MGSTGPNSILKLLDGNALKGAVLTAIGVGVTGNYNDVMLETLANRGNGTYHYIRDRQEAVEFLAGPVRSIFAEVARDARVQVEVDTEAVRKYRSIGYGNRAVSDSDFRDDTLDFGELGFARDVTALYEVRLFDEVRDSDALATASLRWRDARTQEVVEISESISLGDLAKDLDATPYEFRQAAAVAEFAELMRKSYWAQCSGLGAVEELVGEDGDGVLVKMLSQAKPLFEEFYER